VRIGYSKLGRSMTVNEDKYGFQGDAEAPQLLRRLAKRNPNHTFVMIGKHQKGVDRSAWPTNIEWPWLDFEGDQAAVIDHAIATLDANIVHMGQHGTSHQRLPMVPDTWAEVHAGAKELTSPLMSAVNYGEYLTWILNNIGDRTRGQAPVSYIVTDPRNYVKARDIKWPTGLDRILAQHSYVRTQTHDRFEDSRLPAEFDLGPRVIDTKRGGELWTVEHTYRHGGLELMILPDDWETWGSNTYEQRSPIGVATTSAWEPKPELRRSAVVKSMILDMFPDAEVFGRYDAKCLAADLPAGFELRENRVSEFPDVMQRWRVTMAMSAMTRTTDGIGWTTSKPLQAFAARTVCLFHPELDAQGWLLPSRQALPGLTEVSPGFYSIRNDWTKDELELARWLRVRTAFDVGAVVAVVNDSPTTWEWLVNTQRSLLKRRWDEHFTERVIEHQLGLTS
jgi:hypothetical protein